MSWAPECQVCASTEVGSWFLCFSSRRVGPYIHQNTVLQFSLWNRMVSVAVLAVHVSKKHGIRGESGDREGTSANCLSLPWLRCWWHARVTRWDSFAEENEKGNWVGFEIQDILSRHGHECLVVLWSEFRNTQMHLTGWLPLIVAHYIWIGFSIGCYTSKWNFGDVKKGRVYLSKWSTGKGREQGKSAEYFSSCSK